MAVILKLHVVFQPLASVDCRLWTVDCGLGHHHNLPSKTSVYFSIIT